MSGADQPIRAAKASGAAVAGQIPVWTWRDAVRQCAIPPLTKLVCYSIANYLSDVGAGCFPGIATLMRDTGLSNRSLATHIQNAVDAGLLTLERRKGSNGRHLVTHYLPRFPAHATLARNHASMQKTHDGVSGRFSGADHVKDIHVDQDEGGHDSLHVKDIHVDEPGEGYALGPRELGDKVHVNLVQHRSIQERTIQEGNIQTPFTPASGGGEDFYFSEDEEQDHQQLVEDHDDGSWLDGPEPDGETDRGRSGQRRGTATPLSADAALPLSRLTKQGEWIRALRQCGRHHHAVEGLAVPLLEGWRFSSADPVADLAQAMAAANGMPAPHLAKVLDVLRAAEVATIKPERLMGAIRAVKTGGLMVPLQRARDAPQWKAWVAHYARHEPKVSALMNRFDAWQVPAPWPPGHPMPPNPQAAGDCA